MSIHPTKLCCTINLRFAKSSLIAVPDCWVVDHPAVEALHGFVQEHSESLIQQLDFAIVQLASCQRIVLRKSHPSASTLTLTQVGRPFVKVSRLPNLYVPAGFQVSPPLRRDLIREWLSVEGQLSLMELNERGEVHVHRIHLSSFRPLMDWVEYTSCSPRTLRPKTWLPALLKFEVFQIEESAPKKKNQTTERKATEGIVLSVTPKVLAAIKGRVPERVLEDVVPEPNDASTKIDASIIEQLKSVEDQFRDSTLPLDDPTRTTLWNRLADLNQRAGFPEDAIRCWAFALWEGDSEIRPPQRVHHFSPSLGQTITSICQQNDPSIAMLHQLVISLIELSHNKSQAWDPSQNALVNQILEEHDFQLPIRLTWLVWLALTKLGGNDVLRLIRARDRILGSLLEHGLRKDRDFPSFFYARSTRRSDQITIDSALFLRVRDMAWSWCSGGQKSRHWHRSEGASSFKVFVDLTFAASLARFGDHQLARTMLNDIEQHWERLPFMEKSEAYHWLFSAYRERIQQWCRGELVHGPLPIYLRQDLDGLLKHERETVDRFLQFSRILEPFERIDPYRNSRPASDDLQKTLNEISSLTPSGKHKHQRGQYTELLERRFRELFQAKNSPRNQLRILAVAVPLGTRIGESFAMDCLFLLEKVLPKLDQPLDVLEISRRVELLETAAVTAAHYGRTALIPNLVEQLQQLISRQKGEIAALFARATGGGNYRFLSRLGLKTEARELLDITALAMMSNQRVTEVMIRPGLNREVYIHAFAKLAAGWFYFGDFEQADEAIMLVQNELLEGQSRADVRAELATAYVTALGMAPISYALQRYEEVFNGLELTRLSAERMFVQHLMVVEAIVLSLSADDFSSGEQTRHWLEEDEFLVRRRIHRDVEQARRIAGL